MTNFPALLAELKKVLEDVSPSGAAPPGGAPGANFFGGSLAATPQNEPLCPACDQPVKAPLPCLNCFPYGPPLKPLGGKRKKKA